MPARAPGKPALGPNQADVTVPGPGRIKAIPNEFLGLSTEYSTLPLVEKHPVLWARVLFDLVPGGNIPVFSLRIGGDSAEHVIYGRKPPQFAPWEVFSPTPQLIDDTAKAISASKLQVIIDINTITSTPREAAAWMQQLLSALYNVLGGRIVAFELGNEPDIYTCSAWAGGLLTASDQSAETRQTCPAKLPKRITATSFAKSFQAYARALYSVAPSVRLMAPALAEATDHLGWIKTLLHYRTKNLKVITAHVYPYSACAKPGQATYPTIQKVLSENATAGMAKTIAPAVALAHKAGLSLRLTEINSVTCGGTLGVSNTFATALWAPDALFELMNAGVEGVNLHARVNSINRPFSFTRQGLETRPLLYGLILFKRMLGPGARLVPVQLRAGGSLHLKAWAVRASYSTDVGEGPFIRNPLNVLLINKGPGWARITLHLPSSHPGFVERLLAPSASSTSGVTLEGQHLNHQAMWQGKPKVQVIRPSRDGSYVLWVRGESAALLTVPVAPGTLNSPGEHAAGPAPTFGYM
ncbi:MAG TPA: glycosyl hydrolase family 79 C-terminal domain-containing protein [Solirubrobacteraceae bacterium]|nr:glycosyl hydrolase family 79 C-terminal domain-containing protein [Solirubrobacteraceae bacterium]